MTNQERFESWLSNETPRYDTLKLQDGSYRNPVTALLWRCWKESERTVFNKAAELAMTQF